MYTYKIQHFTHEDLQYSVITSKEQTDEVAIMGDHDGYDYSLMTEVIHENNLEHTWTDESDQDWEEYTHEYFCEWKSTS